VYAPKMKANVALAEWLGQAQAVINRAAAMQA